MRILLIRLSSLGDIVLTQPVVQVLRDNFPQARIEYITKKAFSGIVEAFKEVDEIYYWENKKKLLSQLRKDRFDLIVDLHRKFNSFLIKSLLKSKRTVTYKKRHLYRWLIIKKIVRTPNRSMTKINLDSLIKTGIKIEYRQPQLYTFPDLQKNIDELFAINGIDGSANLIGIFPGTLHPNKQYPLENYARMINSVPADWNCQFLILGSEKEKSLGLELVEKTDFKAIDLCGSVNLKELLNLMSRLEIVVSGDSGPMHIAAGLKKKQIALFGSTHPLLGFSPQNENAIILKKDISCQPCSLYGGSKCPRKHFRCMKDLDPDLIKQSLKVLLDKKP